MPRTDNVIMYRIYILLIIYQLYGNYGFGVNSNGKRVVSRRVLVLINYVYFPRHF